MVEGHQRGDGRRKADRYCVIAELKKKRAFRKFSYRGIDLDEYVAIRSPSDTPYVHEMDRAVAFAEMAA